MIDKKIVVVIVIFIVGGLFVYSFANPANDNDKGNDYITPETPPVVEETPVVETPPVVEETPVVEPTPETVKTPVVKPKPTPKPTPTPPVVTPPVEPSKPEIKPTFAVFNKAEDEIADIAINIDGNSINIKGQMEEKNPIVIEGKPIDSGRYVRIKISAPAVYTESELANATIKTNKGTYGRSELSIDPATGKAYFYYITEFNNSDGINITKIPMKIYWGYGETISYNLLYDIVVTPKVTP